MRIRSTKEDGFSVIELLIVIIVVLIIGAVGYLVFNRYERKTATAKPLTSTDTAGWLTYKLKCEEATFKYPKSWKPTYLSSGGDCSAGDDIIFYGPDNFSVEVSDSTIGDSSSCPFPEIVGAEKLTFNGKTGYLDLLSDNRNPCEDSNPAYNGKVNSADLSSSPKILQPFQSKNRDLGPADTADGDQNALEIDVVSYSNNNESINNAKDDINYQTLIYMIETFSYP